MLHSRLDVLRVSLHRSRMRFGPRRYRSAGVPVSRAVYRLIAAGDRARDEGLWGEAASHYAAAVATRPQLVHIGIQLGHALKESGRLSEAEQAYRAAYAVQPGHRDARLHLAHALKLRGALDEAASLYTSLAIADPDDEEAMRESRDILGRLDDEPRRALAAALAASSGAEGFDAPDDGYPAIETCRIVYDASDLIAFFSHSRRPTGIQRVQLEVLVHGLTQTRNGEAAVGVCCFIDGRDEWVALPPTAFLTLATLSVANDDGEAWGRLRDRLALWLLVAAPFEFAEGAALVNLGTSWWLQNYFLHVRDAQARRGIIYIPMIYDFIPVLFPDWCIDKLVQDFVAWAEGVFAHTTHFLAISESSKRDLVATAGRTGYTIPADNVVVVPLQADFGGTDSRPTLDLSPIVGEPFVLFVSTIEPRKGHLVAFDAWSRLIERLGPASVPRLVCVGRNGWRNAAVFKRLASDPALQQQVTIVADLSDATLGALYQASLFTIYPSLYEGWGLPVTEALCRGKVVVTTTSSSLPEAGGSFAFFVPPGDADALADQVQTLVSNPSMRQAREATTAALFRSAGWNAIARQIGEAVATLDRQAKGSAGDSRLDLPPVARLGSWYWLSRSYAMTLRRADTSGEAFRAGLNWRAPDERGCRIKRGGAVLAMRADPALVSPGERLSATLRLVGSERERCGYVVDGGMERAEGVLGLRERLAVTIGVKVAADGIIRIAIGAGSGQEGRAAGLPISSADVVGIDCFVLERRGEPGCAENQLPS